MSQIYVASSSAIQDVISNLTTLNASFREQAANIDSEQHTLTTKWEGDASTAFQEHYQGEKQNFENFATAIDEYIQGLQTILDNYEAAETTNTNIASD